MWAVPEDAGEVMCMGASAGSIRARCEERAREGRVEARSEREARHGNRREVERGEWAQVCELARATHASEEGGELGGDGVDVVPHLEGAETGKCAYVLLWARAEGEEREGAEARVRDEGTGGQRAAGRQEGREGGRAGTAGMGLKRGTARATARRPGWPGAGGGDGTGHTNPLKEAHTAAVERKEAWQAVKSGQRSGAAADLEQAEIRKAAGHRNRGVKTAHGAGPRGKGVDGCGGGNMELLAEEASRAEAMETWMDVLVGVAEGAARAPAGREGGEAKRGDDEAPSTSDGHLAVGEGRGGAEGGGDGDLACGECDEGEADAHGGGDVGGAERGGCATCANQRGLVRYMGHSNTLCGAWGGQPRGRAGPRDGEAAGGTGPGGARNEGEEGRGR